MQLSSNKNLKQAYQDMFLAYCDFFEIHRKRVYGYIKIATLVGRTETNNSAPTKKCPFEKLGTYDYFSHTYHENKKLYRELFDMWRHLSFMFFESSKERNKLNILPKTQGMVKLISFLLYIISNFLEYLVDFFTKKHFKTSDLAMHNSRESCYLAINGYVYDVTQYLYLHPGGEKILMASAGLDATFDFNQVHQEKVIKQSLKKLAYFQVKDFGIHLIKIAL